MAAARAPLDARQAAVRLLAARDRTRAQVDQALEARGHGARARLEALVELERLGYLDDRRTGEALARRWLGEGHSQGGVTQRLVAKGVDPALAAAVVKAEAAASGHTDEVAARRLLEARGVAGPRAARLLAARGFSEDLVARLLGLVAP
jgi:regulatory protein